MVNVLDWCWQVKASRTSRPSRRVHARRSLHSECLEPRTLLSGITFQFDYTYDSNHFFDTQTKKDLLQQAAQTFSNQITDTLSPIVPTSSNTWSAVFVNPANGADASVNNLTITDGELLVYVGGRSFSSTELGEGGPGGYNANGTQTWLDTVAGRGQAGAVVSGTKTDFGPWGGSIAFDTAASWYYGANLAGIKPGQTDFLSVATHELGHVLGFGTADSFHALVSGGSFQGGHANSLYGSPVPVSSDGGHWGAGVSYAGQEASMTPSIPPNTRKTFTALDFAGLQDLGWTLSTGAERMLRAAHPTAYHFFTTSLGEFEFAISHGFTDESTNVPGFAVEPARVSGSLQLHRLYNPNNGRHYLTTSDGERDVLVRLGWNYEKDEGNIYPTQVANTYEVFHLYNTQAGTHLFTASGAEKDSVLQHFPGIWRQDASLGFATYVPPTTQLSAVPGTLRITTVYVPPSDTPLQSMPPGTQTSASVAAQVGAPNTAADTRATPTQTASKTDAAPTIITPVTAPDSKQLTTDRSLAAGSGLAPNLLDAALASWTS